MTYEPLRQRDNAYFMYCLYNEAPPWSESSPPETVDAEQRLDPASAVYELETGIKKGRRFHGSPEARQAIELYSMEKARQHLEAEGWSTIEDVSKKRSYDLLCIDGHEQLMVEVKGTTSAGSKVLLTANEVDNAREFPNVALIVVSGISVTPSATGEPVAGGGTVTTYGPPWVIDPECLTGKVYEYETPD